MPPASRSTEASSVSSLVSSAESALAGYRLELPVGRFLLEVRARDERLRQVLRVLDDGRHDKPVARNGVSETCEVFGHGSTLAVRHAIRTQPAGQHVPGRDLQSAPALRATGRADVAAEERILLPAAQLPFGHGISLQCARTRRGCAR